MDNLCSFCRFSDALLMNSNWILVGNIGINGQLIAIRKLGIKALTRHFEMGESILFIVVVRNDITVNFRVYVEHFCLGFH